MIAAAPFKGIRIVRLAANSLDRTDYYEAKCTECGATKRFFVPAIGCTIKVPQVVFSHAHNCELAPTHLEAYIIGDTDEN